MLTLTSRIPHFNPTKQSISLISPYRYQTRTLSTVLLKNNSFPVEAESPRLCSPHAWGSQSTINSLAAPPFPNWTLSCSIYSVRRAGPIRCQWNRAEDANVRPGLLAQGNENNNGAVFRRQRRKSTAKFAGNERLHGWLEHPRGTIR